MKKAVFVLVVCAALAAVSCATSGTTGGGSGEFATQQEVNDAFEKVYNAYTDALILDGATSYTVVKGDTLSKIARANYGADNLYYFPVIMLASHEATVKDPDLIEPGMKLSIPDLKKNLANPASKGKIKSYLGDIAGIYDKKNQDAAARKLRDLAASL